MKILLVLMTAIAVAVPYPAMAKDNPDRCAQLRRQLEIIDSLLTKRPSPELTERRRLIVEKMTALKCPGESSG
jgi:hypothetical protein